MNFTHCFSTVLQTSARTSSFEGHHPSTSTCTTGCQLCTATSQRPSDVVPLSATTWSLSVDLSWCSTASLFRIWQQSTGLLWHTTTVLPGSARSTTLAEHPPSGRCEQWRWDNCCWRSAASCCQSPRLQWHWSGHSAASVIRNQRACIWCDQPCKSKRWWGQREHDGWQSVKQSKRTGRWCQWRGAICQWCKKWWGQIRIKWTTNINLVTLKDCFVNIFVRSLCVCASFLSHMLPEQNMALIKLLC